jgi:hypothetical protein
MKRIAIVCAALALGLIVGCASTKPVLNISNAPIGGTHTMEQVRQAIIAAGQSRGWIMQETQPGLVHGTLKARGHQADVDVPYSTTSYSINYASSVALDYKDGKIHRNYNKWVENLDAAIKVQLGK